jgi:glycosyltransferase involved in cell wall biosynthesis
MNAAAFSAISAVETTHYVGPIDPPILSWQKLISKCRRLAGSQGRFFFFSDRRLNSIADEFRSKYHRDARLNFFHGFTPWIMTRPERSYIAWSDCTFRDYVDIFCNRRQFEARDLQRIERAEATWLQGAQKVLFTSKWAANRAVDHYGLKDSQVRSVGIFGNLEMPERDVYAGGKDFVFASTNFHAKGGATVISAFREVKKRHSGATLTIVGNRPSDVLAEPGTNFTGLLRKEVYQEQQQLQEILGRARALVHPTKSDIAPLLIVEAGYVGCPVIASRCGAIPELVDHLRTGLLLETGCGVDTVARAMCWMLENEDAYLRMRRLAWVTAQGSHSRREFEQRLLASIQEVTAESISA